jgi:hypothetical protein
MSKVDGFLRIEERAKRASRLKTGWMIADQESTDLTTRFIEETCTKQRIKLGQLTAHADLVLSRTPDRGRTRSLPGTTASLITVESACCHRAPFIMEKGNQRRSSASKCWKPPMLPDRNDALKDIRLSQRYPGPSGLTDQYR